MTYDQLKALPLNQLLHLIGEQVEMAKRTWDPVRLCRHPDCGVEPPTLCLMGDFEIRARFHDCPEKPCGCGRHAMLGDKTPDPLLADFLNDVRAAYDKLREREREWNQRALMP